MQVDRCQLGHFRSSPTSGINFLDNGPNEHVASLINRPARLQNCIFTCGCLIGKTAAHYENSRKTRRRAVRRVIRVGVIGFCL